MQTKTLIKICGITNLADAQKCADMGADALGFIFAPHSKRYVTPQQAKQIGLALGPSTGRVGVYVESSSDVILRQAEEARLSAVQLHGDVTLEVLQEVSQWYPVLRVLTPAQLSEQVSARLDSQDMRITVLLDAPQAGGGIPLDWCAIRRQIDADTTNPTPHSVTDFTSHGKNHATDHAEDPVEGYVEGLVKSYPQSYPQDEQMDKQIKKADFWLAGGLGAHNVAEAMRILKPRGVDAVSRLEARAGIKDLRAVRDFVAAVRAADADT